MTNPKRGNVCLVNFDPTLGAEIRKTRSALVLQSDIANWHSPITIGQESEHVRRSDQQL